MKGFLWVDELFQFSHLKVHVVSCDWLYLSLETDNYLLRSGSLHFLLTSDEIADTQRDQRGTWEASSISPFTFYCSDSATPDIS